MHLAMAVELGQQLRQIGIDLCRGKVTAPVAGQNIDVERPIVHLAERIAAIPAVSHLEGDKVLLEAGGIERALHYQQAVEKVVAGVHSHRLGADHRTQPQGADVHKQLGQRAADMDMRVNIGTNATQIEHAHLPGVGLI